MVSALIVKPNSPARNMFPGAVWILLVVGLAVPAFFILTWIISSFNRVTGLRKAYAHAYAQVDALLKQRNDLILNVVETAKGYIVHEPGATEAVLAARNSASAANFRAAQLPGDPTAMRELSATETALVSALRRLLLAAQADPEITKDKAMAGLESELIVMNQQLAGVRQKYNDAVMRYNLVRTSFPNNVIALPFGFTQAEMFQSELSKKPEAPPSAA